MAIGYIELDDWLPFRKMFTYMDAVDHDRAVDIFNKHKLSVRVKKEWQTPNSRYKLVFCTVPKKQVPMFKFAIDELRCRMLLLGYEDYAEFWIEMITSFGDSEILETLTLN